MNSTKPCTCGICKLAKACDSIAKKCTKRELATLDELWARMEGAESILDYRDYRAKKRQSMMINKVKYVPERK